MSISFTDEDRAFLIAILNNPAELTAWLAYADWLDDRSDPRAEFIRLQLKLAALSALGDRTPLEARAAELAQTLDPVWVATVDRTRVENCSSPFRFRCPLKWEQLTRTPAEDLRFCETCRQEVLYCRSLPEAQQFAAVGYCVAISRGVLRTPNDFQTPQWPEEGFELGLLEEDEPDDVRDELDDPDVTR